MCWKKNTQQCIGHIVYSVHQVEPRILHIARVVLKIFHIHSQLKRDLFPASKAMDFVEPQPKFTLRLTKPIFILSPVLVEADTTILSPLENGPSPSICLLITEDCERVKFVWFNDVHSRECVSPRQHFCAISRVFRFICTRAKSVAQSTRL